MLWNQGALVLFAILSTGRLTAADGSECPAELQSLNLDALKIVVRQAPEDHAKAVALLGSLAPGATVEQKPCTTPIRILRSVIAHESAGIAESAACSRSLLAQRKGASQESASCGTVGARLVEESLGIPSSAATMGLLGDPAGEDSLSLRSLLVEQRRRYKFLKKWLRVLKPENPSDLQDARDELEALRNSLYSVLEDQGLREDFGAELVQGLMFQSTSGEPGGGSDNAQPTYLRIRSRRFGHDYDQDRNLEYMLTMRLGFAPTLLLVEPAETPSAGPAPASKPAPRAASEPATQALSRAGEADTTHEKALMFDLRVDGILTLGSSSEAVFGASYGQTFLDSKTLTRKVDGRELLFATLRSGPGTWAEYWTAGIAYRYFHRAVRDIRAEQPSIDPLLEASVDLRHDARFKLDPSAAGAVRFDRPEQRLVFRFKLAGIPFVDRRNPAAKPVTIGLGIEHERGLSNRGVPSATRIFLAGDISILKAIAGR